MKTRIISVPLLIIILNFVILSVSEESQTQETKAILSSVQNHTHCLNDRSSETCSDCPQGYTYIPVTEADGSHWIYVYCGPDFITKYLDASYRNP